MSGIAPVRVERRGRAAWITLDRPEAANALSRALVRAFSYALADVRAAGDAAVLVVTGAGDRAFSAGADLKERLEMSPAETRAFLDELRAALDALAGFPQPVLAAIAGAALGGGLELALACDIRIASEAAVFGFPEVRLGIIPGAGGTQRLARVCGLAVAKELVLTGRRIGSPRARELGLVSAVVPAAELCAETQRWADEIAEAGPLAVAQAKRALDDGFGLPLPEGLDLEQRCYQVVIESEDRKEGLAAFAEQRKPVFRGR